MLGEKYEIFMEGRLVGQVHVSRGGLYYHLTCICTLPDDGIYRVVAESSHKRFNIGICVPQGNRYIASTSIPVSSIADNIIVFRVTRADCDESLFPASERIPTNVLTELLNGRFEMLRGCPHIRITEHPIPREDP